MPVTAIQSRHREEDAGAQRQDTSVHVIKAERNTFTEGSREDATATRQCLEALRTAKCSGAGGSEDRFHKKAPGYVGTCRGQQGLCFYQHVLEGYEQRTDMTSALKCSCGPLC